VSSTFRTGGDTPRLRLGILAIVVVSLFASLFSRLWFLQVMTAPTYEVAAQANLRRTVYEPAPRGKIVDRNGKVVVDNRISTVVVVDRQEWAEVDDQDAVKARLADVLDVPVSTIEERLDDPEYGPFEPVPIAVDVPEMVVTYLQERDREFPAVSAEQRTLRIYPYGMLAAHVLGTVGRITEAELEAHEGDGYLTNDTIGKTGVEATYEADLRGTPGRRVLSVDSDGNVLGTLDYDPPVPGHDVRLSIDIDVQYQVEQALQDALVHARSLRSADTDRLFPAPAGSMVVEDPRNGDIIAMASLPTYDPLQFVDGVTDEEWSALQAPEARNPLTNRALQGQYAVGSTFKMITAYAALKTGRIDPGFTFYDDGEYEIRFCQAADPSTCLRHNAGGRSYGTVDVARALTVSSDLFFFDIGAYFWEGRDRYGDPMQAAAREFGFGEETGVPLAGEEEGLVPDPVFRDNPAIYKEGEWRTGNSMNLAIGQGDLLATPLQLTNAYASFANGGTVYAPNVADAVLEPGSDEVSREIEPREVRQLDIPRDHYEAILRGLAGVTSDPDGTAYAAFTGFPQDVFSVAGKTGTAQVKSIDPITELPQEDTALFVGFGPVTGPRYVVTAVLEQAGFGGDVAAPAVRRVFDFLSNAFGPVPPAPEGGVLAPPPVFEPQPPGLHGVTGGVE
jgi:penicillin-binding protein 2